MDTYSDIELFGRKTFFIAPDASLIPNSYLEEFMENGFETYIVADDYTCPMKGKIREIIKMFPEAIIFFNIDATIEGIEWKSYIRELQESEAGGALFGILHLRRASQAEEDRIHTYFVRDVQIRAGCISLDPKNHDSFEVIKKVLLQSGARGRRNLVRAPCDSASFVKFEHDGSGFSGRLLDVNITHFLCDLGAGAESFPIFEKFRDVSLSVNGLPILSDAVLIMKRHSGGVNLCIFMFIRRDGSPELEKGAEHKLNQKIYRLVLEKNMARLQSAFASADTLR